MISKELLQKIKYIEILAKNLVATSMSGHYNSVFKGNGLEFSEVREYQYGDDIRSIDWNVSARYGKPFIKKFVEEREFNVFIMVDMSASMRFATSGKAKNQIAAEISALLALSAIRNNDKVGFLLFSDKVDAFFPPNRRKYHVLRMIRELLCYEPHQKQTDLKMALRYFNNLVSKESIVFLISDFWVNDCTTELKMMTRKHDLVPICLRDNLERNIPNVGYLTVEDLENGKIRKINTSSRVVRQSIVKSYEQWLENTMTLFNQLSVDAISIMANEPYFDSLISFFQKRSHR